MARYCGECDRLLMNGFHDVGLGVCSDCRFELKLARWHQIQDLWLDGFSGREIGLIVGKSGNSVGVDIHLMRGAGWDMPYRSSGPELVLVGRRYSQRAA